MPDYAAKALDQLRRWNCDDGAHIDYLNEECRELNKLSAWGDIIDAVRSKERSTNPNNLLVAWLFGISEVDPLCPRTFVFDEEHGIVERCYHFVSDSGEDVPVHFRTHVRLREGSIIPASKVRPGSVLTNSNGAFKVNLIYPSTAKFLEQESLQDIESGVVLAPTVGTHNFKQSNELPDIDVDFPPSILSKIVPLARRMYGEKCVAGVCTYMRLGVRSSIKDVGRVFELPFQSVNELTTFLGNEGNKLEWLKALEQLPPLQKFVETYPTASKIMMRLNGRVKSVGTHASALIISNVPIDGKVPMIRQAGERNELVSAWVEGQSRLELSIFGFCKFDRLGLQTLDDLDLCLNLIYERGIIDRSKGIFRLPGRKNWSDLAYLSDTKALEAAAEGLTNGCFQFDSDGIRGLLRRIKIEKFSELVAANALYRPGVMAATIDGIQGGHEAYCKRKHKEVDYKLDPALEPILGDTYGLMVYQEQVMKVLEIIGGIPLPDCDAVRKAISKKRPKVIARYKPSFVRNAMRTLNCTQEEAELWWENIEAWSGYGFNMCIDPTSVVEHADGRLDHAENCHPGDMILSFDPNQRQSFFDEVVEVHENGVHETFEIELDNGSVQTCTMDHEFLCENGIKHQLREIVCSGLRIMAQVDVAKPICSSPKAFVPCSIVAIRSKGRQRVIDLEMKSKTHNFVSNGIVVGNSHSLAYAIIAMRTLYIKTHYPIEFFCAFMSSIKKSKDGHLKLRTMCSDAARFGIEVLGVDINESRDGFRICRDPLNKDREVLRFGFAYVKGVGKKSESIVANQPYTSFQDFLRRGARQKTAVENLIDAGAFDCLHENRRALKEYYTEWCALGNKGVGKQLFRKFMSAINMPSKSYPHLYDAFCSFLLQGGFPEEDTDTPEDPIDIIDEDIKEATADRFEDDIVPNDINTTTVPAFLMDAHDETVAKPKNKARQSLSADEFSRYVNEVFIPSVPDLDPIEAYEAADRIIDLLPSISIPDCEDYRGSEQCANAAQVYGELMPFEHHLRWAKHEARLISQFGKVGRDGKEQDFIDGYVMNVTVKQPKSKPRNDEDINSEGKRYREPKSYRRILIDDGYDRVMVTCWGRTWEREQHDPKIDKNGDVVTRFDPSTGEHHTVYEDMPSLRETIQPGKCVRLKVEKDPKYGFKVCDDSRAARSITMKRKYFGVSGENDDRHERKR